MVSTWSRSAVVGSTLLILAGCATQRPLGPSVTVMPAPGKPFEVFVSEEHLCRQYADQSLGMTADQTSYKGFAGSAATGTAIGAVAGELLGGHQGASIGAGMGLLAGSSAGSNQAAYSSRDAQWRYDSAYKQCMYAKGNQVPGYPFQRQVTPPPPGYGQQPSYLPPPPPQS